jgi:EAL domain-containing protein (putative c-di-GMP-specific phosphodiesterase class I)
MIEITEHIAIGDVTSTLHMMGELDSLGIGISIDDFGTGYSSLAYVKRFTARELKIDRSFVRDLPHDPGDRAIVKAVISMAHELGMQVTAEGVESEEHYHYLRSLGCDYLQGYYFSQPVPFESLMRLIERGWS